MIENTRGVDIKKIKDCVKAEKTEIETSKKNSANELSRQETVKKCATQDLTSVTENYYGSLTDQEQKDVSAAYAEYMRLFDLLNQK